MADFSPNFGGGFQQQFNAGMPADMASQFAASNALRAAAAQTANFNAQTQRIGTNAEAGLKVAQTGEVAPNALAQRGLVNAQAYNNRSESQTRDLARLFAPQEFYDKSAASAAATNLTNAQKTGQDIDNSSSGIRRSQLLANGQQQPSLFEKMATGLASKGMDFYRGMMTPAPAPNPISINTYEAPKPTFGGGRGVAPLLEPAPPQKSSIAGYAPDRAPTFGWLGPDIASPRYGSGMGMP